MRKRKGLIIAVSFVLFVLVVIGGWQARRFFPYPALFAHLGIENWQVWEFHDYFDLDPYTLSVVIGNQRLRDLEDPPILVNGQVFFPYTFVRERIDPFMFWDASAQALFVTTDTEIYHVPSHMDGIPVPHDGPIPLVPMEFIDERYPFFDVWYREEYNTVIINDWTTTGTIASATTTRRTPIRYLPTNTAFITQRAERGDTMVPFGTDGEFTRVRTREGLLGYILTEHIETAFASTCWLEEYRPSLQPRVPSINLTWEMITAPVGNATAMNNPLPEGLDVISPTWFNFDPYLLDGTIISFADQAYVEWAHNHGVQVWAKAFDSSYAISHAILTNHQARSWAIEQMINFLQDYNIDGININFEHIHDTDGGYYVQFLRELAIAMRATNRPEPPILSVATFVPAPWRRHYHHDLVGQTVDFVAIMTYDEHTLRSPEPGPVASLPFVDGFIQQTLELIPPEKVLMGLPFYSRLWRVAPDGSHTISNIHMAGPQNLLEQWGVTPIWDPVIGSYYANFTDAYNYTYRIWIECERSIREKMRIYTEHELAGVASWRRGLETPGVWEEINAQRQN